tara:strand:- start:1006 stop:1572 length:567 start_codon:yes stop_codon:yes gene_type:complete
LERKIIKNNRSIYIIFIIFLFSGEVSSQDIFLVPDSSIHGAVLGSNKLYKNMAEGIVREFKKIGYMVTQSTDHIRQFIPPKNRISTSEWKSIFRRKEVSEKLLMTLTITRHIERSPINQSQIGFRVQIFEKNEQIRPLAFFFDMPTERTWTISPQCHGPCLNSFYAEKAKIPAKKLIKKIIRLLNNGK